ncbi:MAG: hypothetical protein HC831_30645 [Chloroflexia bacterium]|nr:hypothetical protein [Chloroflexia bacterium]
MPFSKKQLVRIGSHILFWILYYAFVFIEVTFLKDNFNYESAVVSLGLTLPVDIFASYFTTFYL